MESDTNDAFHGIVTAIVNVLLLLARKICTCIDKNAILLIEVLIIIEIRTKNNSRDINIKNSVIYYSLQISKYNVYHNRCFICMIRFFINKTYISRNWFKDNDRLK